MKMCIKDLENKRSLFTTAVLEPPVTLILAKKNRAVIQKGHRNGMNATYQNVVRIMIILKSHLQSIVNS